jgi:guanylate kinase
MDIQALVDTYEPPLDVRQKLAAVKIVLMVGISGAGKDTIKQQALQSPLFRPIISHTTRAPRKNNGVNEVAGADYHFISLDVAATMVAQKQFVEAKYVHGTIYGTSIAEVLGVNTDQIAITDVDVQGVAEYIALSDAVVAIFIVPPSYDTWIERLSKRYATNEEFAAEWPKRRASAISELSEALNKPYYHFVINDTIDDSVRAVIDIAQYPTKPRTKDATAREAARQLLAAIQAV